MRFWFQDCWNGSFSWFFLWGFFYLYFENPINLSKTLQILEIIYKRYVKTLQMSLKFPKHYIQIQENLINVTKT